MSRFTDALARPGIQLRYVLRIEGLPGWWFTAGRPGSRRFPGAEWTRPSGITFNDGLSIPQSFDQAIRPFEAVSSMSPLEFTLTDQKIPSTSPIGAGQYLFTRLFATGLGLGGSGSYSALLTQDVAPGDTDIRVTTTAGAPAYPFLLHCGIEAMLATADGAVPGLSFTVTRARHTAYDGTGLSMRHGWTNRPGVPTPTPDARIATFPDTWQNRRVALYATWVDPATATFSGRLETAPVAPAGAGADYQLVWAGRLQAVAFDVPTDQWKLLCNPLLDELKRKILPRPAHSQLAGIDLAGVPESHRRLSFHWSFGGGPVEVDLNLAAPAAFHTSAVDLTGAINPLILGPQDPNADGNFDSGTVFLTWRDERCVLHVINSSFYGKRLRGFMSAELGVILGFLASQPADDGAFEFETAFLAPGATEDIVAANPAMRYFWSTYGTTMTLPGNDASSFAATQGDGAAAAVRIAGGTVRYEGIAVGPPDALTGTDGPREWGNEATGGSFGDTPPYVASAEPVIVTQAYASPDNYGDELSGHDIITNLLRLLLSTGRTAHNHATYDVLPEGFGLAIPAALVDVAALESIRAEVGATLLSRSWRIAEATPFLDVGGVEARTIGFVWVVNGSGQLSVRPLGEYLRSSDAILLNEANKADPNDRGSYLLSPEHVRNSIVVRYDYYGDQPFSVVSVPFRVAQENWDDDRPAPPIENRGLRSGSGVDAAAVVARAVATIAPYLRTRAQIGRTYSRRLLTLLTPADIVSLTDPGLPDGFTGNRGFSGRTAQIVRLTTALHSTVGRVELHHDGVVPDSLRAPLCPGLLVTALVAGSTYSVAANEFTPSAPDQDLAWFVVGDPVLVKDGAAVDPTVPASVTRTITAIDLALNRVTFNAALPAGLNPLLIPVYVTFDVRAAATAGQLTRGTWLAAASDGRIDAGGGVRVTGRVYL